MPSLQSCGKRTSQPKASVWTLLQAFQHVKKASEFIIIVNSQYAFREEFSLGALVQRSLLHAIKYYTALRKQ
jgi:hypothetical protein